jgi:hypothetical protein
VGAQPVVVVLVVVVAVVAALRANLTTASTVRARMRSTDSAGKACNSTGAETATPGRPCSSAVTKPFVMQRSSSSSSSIAV